jgi:lipoprotein signal peptidase
MTTSYPQDASNFSEAAGGALAGTVSQSGGTWTQLSWSGAGPFYGCIAPDGTRAVYRQNTTTADVALIGPCPLGLDQQVDVDFYVASNLAQIPGVTLLATLGDQEIRARWNESTSQLQIQLVFAGSITSTTSSSAIAALTVGNWYHIRATVTGAMVITTTLYAGKGVSGTVLATVTYTDTSSNWAPGCCGIFSGGAVAGSATTGYLFANFTANSGPRTIQLTQNAADLTSTLNNGNTYDNVNNNNIIATPSQYICLGLAQTGLVNESPADIVQWRIPKANWPASWATIPTPTVIYSGVSGSIQVNSMAGIYLPATSTVLVLFFTWPSGYNENTSTPTDHYQVKMITSANEGASWSAATDVTGTFYLAGGTSANNFGNAFAVDASGRLYWVCGVNSGGTGFSGTDAIYCFYSDNNGSTWSPPVTIENPAPGSECKIAALPNGSLMATIRNNNGGNAIFYRSTNRGVSWSSFTPATNTPVDPGITAAFFCDTDGYLYYAGPNESSDAFADRILLTLWYSTDGGADWNVVTNPTANYPSGTLVDGTGVSITGGLGCTYYCDACSSNDGTNDLILFGARSYPAGDAQNFDYSLNLWRVNKNWLGVPPRSPAKRWFPGLYRKG